MSNIFNFANRQMCEYASIFPTTVALLDHLLFTIGNGYGVDYDSGMIVDGNNQRIDTYPALTAEQWVELIEACRQKEVNFEKEFSGRFRDFSMERVDEKCKIYKVQNVTEECFEEENLLSEIKSTDLQYKSKKWGERHYRPYPLSEKHSDIYRLNKNTPAWFLQIAINLCNAWIKFLNTAIETDDVCKNKEHDYADMTYTIKHRDMLLDIVDKLTNLTKGK